MNQLILDFDSEDYPGFDAFLGRANTELIHMLQLPHEQFIYVWGEKGVGKSHLLRAWVSQAAKAGYQAYYIDAASTPLTEQVFDADYLAVDQIEKLNAAEQDCLFTLFNRYRNNGEGHLLCSADVPPAYLTMREDLRTRMAYCLVYEVLPLSDQEKIEALASIAHSRNLNIDTEIFHYLLNYWERDMDSLMAILNTLIEYSITIKKPMTLPLVRSLLKQTG